MRGEQGGAAVPLRVRRPRPSTPRLKRSRLEPQAPCASRTPVVASALSAHSEAPELLDIKFTRKEQTLRSALPLKDKYCICNAFNINLLRFSDDFTRKLGLPRTSSDFLGHPRTSWDLPCPLRTS